MLQYVVHISVSKKLFNVLLAQNVTILEMSTILDKIPLCNKFSKLYMFYIYRLQLLLYNGYSILIDDNR
jgi:hypothetical protein